MANITYQDGIMHFEDGTTMDAPVEVRRHMGDHTPVKERHIIIIKYKSGECLYYSRQQFLGMIGSGGGLAELWDDIECIETCDAGYGGTHVMFVGANHV